MVLLLRAGIPTIRRGVFWNEDFEPGEEWFNQFTAELLQANRMFVFWCAHALDSEQVFRAYDFALSHSCVVVPILLDETPLPDALKSIHAVDLREMFRHDLLPPETTKSVIREPHYPTDYVSNALYKAQSLIELQAVAQEFAQLVEPFRVFFQPASR
jgi:hypothetical protein